MGQNFKVIFAPQAGRDLESAVRYIAERFGLLLVDKALSLAAFPERGRVVPEPGLPLREIFFRSYRIVFRVRGDVVEVRRTEHHKSIRTNFGGAN